MKSTWFVKTRFVGEFNSPANFPFHTKFYCQDCGETYATKLQEGAKYWHYDPGHCGCISIPYNSLAYTFSYLRSPFEVDKGFSPIEILAEELLLELDRLPKEVLCQSPQTLYQLPSLSQML